MILKSTLSVKMDIGKRTEVYFSYPKYEGQAYLFTVPPEDDEIFANLRSAGLNRKIITSLNWLTPCTAVRCQRDA